MMPLNCTRYPLEQGARSPMNTSSSAASNPRRAMSMPSPASSSAAAQKVNLIPVNPDPVLAMVPLRPAAGVQRPPGDRRAFDRARRYPVSPQRFRDFPSTHSFIIQTASHAC